MLQLESGADVPGGIFGILFYPDPYLGMSLDCDEALF